MHQNVEHQCTAPQGWLDRLFRRPRIHRWKTTHTNRWQTPTAQFCEQCGITRRMDDATMRYPEGWPAMWYRWSYSNGAKGPWREIVNDEIVDVVRVSEATLHPT